MTNFSKLLKVLLAIYFLFAAGWLLFGPKGARYNGFIELGATMALIHVGFETLKEVFNREKD